MSDRGPGPGSRRQRRRRARHGSEARLPPDRSDLIGSTTAATRPLEPPRTLRLGRARPPALGRAQALRVGRIHLADRGLPAHPSPDAPQAWQGQVRAARDRVPADERALQAVPAPRARRARTVALTRDRGRPDGVEGPARLVGKPQGDAHARAAPGPRGRCNRRTPRQAARLGPRRAVVPGGRQHPLARGRAAARGEALSCPRGQVREGTLACASRRRGWTGAEAGDISLTVRPPHPRPRSCRSALGLSLPPRDVRSESEARVRVLRPPYPAR